MSLFQSNLRKQIRNLPKILNFVKIIHYFSKLITSLLTERSAPPCLQNPDGLILRRFEGVPPDSRTDQTSNIFPIRWCVVHIGDEVAANRQLQTKKVSAEGRTHCEFQTLSIAFTGVHKLQSRSDRIAASLQLLKYEKVD